MLKVNTKQYIEEQDFSSFVSSTYGRPYRFQQQEGCQDRGLAYVSVPSEGFDFDNDSIPEDGSEMGVSFKAWLERDPKAPVGKGSDQPEYIKELFWYRNFYPHIDMILNDLYDRDLIGEGDYTIVIDW